MSGLAVMGCLPRVNAQQGGPRGLPHLAYHFRKMTQAEGLSSYNVKKIVQDRYGYTWIATQDGLNRFDGKNITLYNKSADPPRRLVSNDIWDVAEDTARHCLWVLSYSGLDAIDLATGQVLPDPRASSALSQRLPNGWFTCLHVCGARLWIGSHYGMAIYDIDRHVFESFEPLPLNQVDSNDQSAIEHFWRDEYGRIWVLVANYGIVLYSAATGRILQHHPLAELGMRPQKDFDRFRTVAPLTRGRMAMATNRGLFDIRYDQYRFGIAPFSLPGKAAGLASQEIYSCTTDPHGNLWFGADNALYRLETASGRTVEIKDADYANPENWFSDIYCIFFDPFDHLWLGTQKGTAFSTTTASPFAAYFQSSDYTTVINHANFPFPWQDSLLYVCAEDGFYQVNMLSNTIRRLAKGEFFYAAILKDGHLLVSRKDRLCIWQHDTLLDIGKVYPELEPIGGEPIQGLVWCGDSLAIMGSQNSHGIFCWYPGRQSLVRINEHSRPLALASDVVNGLYHDHRGRVWIPSDASCSIFDPARHSIDTFHVDDPYTHRPATFYFDVTEAQGLYWLALYGTGLAGLDSNLHLRKVFSSREGLANTGVYKVFAWQDSLLFVTSNNGLSRIRLTDASVVNYFQKDGLHGNGFEEACGYFDGRYIYAGGERGVSRIEPGLIPADPAPPALRFGNIRLQTPSTSYDIGDISSATFTVPADVVRATVTVFTFNYTDDRRTRLSYSIPELKTPWIPLGTTPTIDLLGLSPGRYTILVRASDPNGPAAERRLALAIDWLPKWYQTLWFKLLVIAALVLLFYLFYRYRISQIRQQQLIRQNISSDLHDDIGSILNTIKIFTHLARKGPNADNWLAQIETSLAQAVVAVRDMIWVLDDSQDTVYELLERIRQFAIPLAAAQGIRLEVAADGTVSQSLHKDEKRNLLLVTKESVNNSLKYAGCTRLSIRIAATGKSISLRIEDDGAGFDPKQVTNGNGLRNISRRAQKMHYSATIDSAPGAGTRIILAKDQG